MTLKRLVSLPVSAVLMLAASAPAIARSAQDRRDEKMAEIPVCAKKLGAVAVVEPETDWWREAGLGSPEALIKVFVRRSNCFTLVDRGKGMQALQAERSLAANGDLRGDSNLGQGQIKAADYVLVPDLISTNNKAGGHHFGGLVGGLTGHHSAGVLLGGLNTKKKTADVVLTVTDVRSSEQVAAVEGHAKKTDIGWGSRGSLFSTGGFGGAGVAGYSDTEIGQVITLAYLQAYTDLVTQLGGLPENPSEANVPATGSPAAGALAGGGPERTAPQTTTSGARSSRAVVMSKPGRMYATPETRGQVVKSLESGTLLYPTGQKQDVFWEVTDELGAKGWVSSVLFQPAR
jgi:hypothetical protein